MSYDLMVFEPGAAPKEHEGFLDWYAARMEGQTEVKPFEVSSSLQAWYADIKLKFLALNDLLPYAEPPEDLSNTADYQVGKDFIYACFAWSKSEEAFQLVVELATKHQLGFFNVSSEEGEVWLPQEGRLVLSHQKKHPSWSSRLLKLLRRE